MRVVSRRGAVVAVPLVLVALGAGALGVSWSCADTETSALESGAWSALAAGALLLPVVVIAGMLRSPGRATRARAFAALLVAVAVVTALVVLLGAGLKAEIPWSMMACYAVTLVATAWAPLPRPDRSIVLWGAAMAAAWTPLAYRFMDVLLSDQDTAGRNLTVQYYARDAWGESAMYVSGRPLTPGLVYGDAVGSWTGGATVFGPPLVIVALVAALSTETTRRVARYVAGALLGLMAVAAGFHVRPDWSLVLGALVVLAAVEIRPRAWAGRLRSVRARMPLRPRDLAFWSMVTVAALWLVVTSFS